MSDSAGFRFGIQRGELKLSELFEAVLKEMRGIQPLEVVRNAVSPGFWIGAAKSVADLIGQLVDVPIADVLTGAWRTHRKFAKFTDETKYPPGKASLVPLASHELSATQKCYITIFLDERPQGKIEFDFILDVTVETGVVVVQDKRLMRLEAGKAKATGTLKCAGTTVAERVLREYSWKEGISFGAGIPIEAAR